MSQSTRNSLIVRRNPLLCCVVYVEVPRVNPERNSFHNWLCNMILQRLLVSHFCVMNFIISPNASTLLCLYDCVLFFMTTLNTLRS